MLTRDGADVVVVVAAAVTGDAVLITSAAGDVAIIGLVASIPAGCVWDDWNGQDSCSVINVNYVQFLLELVLPSHSFHICEFRVKPSGPMSNIKNGYYS